MFVKLLVGPVRLSVHHLEAEQGKKKTSRWEGVGVGGGGRDLTFIASLNCLLFLVI